MHWNNNRGSGSPLGNLSNALIIAAAEEQGVAIPALPICAHLRPHSILEFVGKLISDSSQIPFIGFVSKQRQCLIENLCGVSFRQEALAFIYFVANSVYLFA